MGTRDPRIDAYIDKSAPFAQPILGYLRTVVRPKKLLTAPPYFMTALKKNKKALATYESFSPSHRRDYLEWVTEAKGEETRQRRLATAVEWVAEGKPRNWKVRVNGANRANRANRGTA